MQKHKTMWHQPIPEEMVAANQGYWVEEETCQQCRQYQVNKDAQWLHPLLGYMHTVKCCTRTSRTILQSLIHEADNFKNHLSDFWLRSIFRETANGSKRKIRKDDIYWRG